MVPEWANFFSDKKYTLFIELVSEYFTNINLEISIDEDCIFIHNEILNLGHLGLTNLSQICNQNPMDDWKEIITNHFNLLIEAQKNENDILSNINDFNMVKNYIGIRLYNSEYIKSIGQEYTLFKNITEDIIALLVFDLPSSIKNIKPDEANKWNVEFENLFKLGVDNIKNKYQYSKSNEEINDFNIWLIQSDNLFCTNIIFHIDNDKSLIGQYGSLVGIPHRHAVIIYPIENLEVVKAINALIPIISGMEKEGPGSISKNLYWYNKENFINLPYEVKENKLDFFPPSEFIDTLNKLK